VIYLTYNDPPSGIYKSQVIDVVKYLNQLQTTDQVKLVALISLRTYSADRKKIKAELPESVVIPMIPGVKRWKLNYFILRLFLLFSKHTKMICRGPFAAHLALQLRSKGHLEKVVFDARGAYTAELNEYNVIPDETIKQEISRIEEYVVNNSDFRLAVSEMLANYWWKMFSYLKKDHVIIPCTLNTDFEFELPTQTEIEKLRNDLGYNEKDIVFVYSGSAAGWQSFHLIDGFITSLMEEHPNVKLLVLSSHFDPNFEVIKRYSDRVIIKWVPAEQVKNHLLASDYGILFREETITNKVASPVKFAEYLSCGLKVVISDNLGDYTKFSHDHDLKYHHPKRVQYEEKKRIQALCYSNFLKEKFKNSYLNILNC
jgi:hypothetical protein